MADVERIAVAVTVELAGQPVLLEFVPPGMAEVTEVRTVLFDCVLFASVVNR